VTNRKHPRGLLIIRNNQIAGKRQNLRNISGKPYLSELLTLTGNKYHEKKSENDLKMSNANIGSYHGTHLSHQCLIRIKKNTRETVLLILNKILL
jgi:hypothetical protein